MKGAYVLAGMLFGSIGCRTYPLPPTANVRVSDQVEEVGSTGTYRLKPGVCTGMSLAAETAPLTMDTFLAFLKGQGVRARVVTERTDLTYVDVELTPNKPARLRVASLGSAAEAGEELAKAMSQQGEGSWGVRRSNVAILGPAGHFDDVIAFATKTRMACWGVLTFERGDDAVVVPGGYLEF